MGDTVQENNTGLGLVILGAIFMALAERNTSPASQGRENNVRAVKKNTVKGHIFRHLIEANGKTKPVIRLEERGHNRLGSQRTECLSAHVQRVRMPAFSLTNFKSALCGKGWHSHHTQEE
jgi:hypothetical protein